MYDDHRLERMENKLDMILERLGTFVTWRSLWVVVGTLFTAIVTVAVFT